MDISMPKLSDTMEDGKILRWLKQPGETVALGDVLAEVETDKADMELEASGAGVLDKILVQEGESAAVGDVIAVLRDGKAAPGGSRAERSAKLEEPEESEEPEEREQPFAEDTETPRGKAMSAPPSPAGAAPKAAERPQIGSGPGGRVVKRDLEPREEARQTKPASPTAARSMAPASGSERLSNIRRTVARRMAESKRQVPHFYMTVEIEMTECARLKDSLATARPGVPVSFTHFLLRAVALALGEHPRIQARYSGEDEVQFSEGIHLGIAVALDEGLIVPVVHDCQDKNLFEIADEARAVVERTRAGKPHKEDLGGGTFTISNLGMFPIEEFAAVINQPQAAVLAVGALKNRAIVRNGELAVAPTMRVTLSSDHRVIDGVEAARFLATMKELLENAVRLVL